MADKAWNKASREISKEWRWLDGIGRAMPLAVRAEGWRAPHVMPLKPLALASSEKCTNLHLWWDLQQQKKRVRGNMQHLRMLFWLVGLDCWHPRCRSCTTRHISRPAAVIFLLTAMVTATVSLQHPQAECVLCLGGRKKKILLLLLHPAQPHTMWQCDPSGFYNMGSLCQGLGAEWCY